MSETVGELGLNFLDVSRSSGTWSASPFGLHGPVELADLGRLTLLDMVVGFTCGSAQGMGFVVALAHGGCTLSHVRRFF